MNFTPGYYWAYRSKNQQMPEIVRLTKSGWDFMGGNPRMGRPYKVLYKIENFDETKVIEYE